eukprot:scaffold681420_cov120-Prasinocladus_malaysianus.AAC.1
MTLRAPYRVTIIPMITDFIAAIHPEFMRDAMLSVSSYGQASLGPASSDNLLQTPDSRPRR